MNRKLILLIGCAVFLSACTSTKWVRTSVTKEYGLSVTLEQRQEKGAIVMQKYQQPKSVDLDVLKTLMGDLVYIEKAGLMSNSKQHPVFQSDETERLAPVLVAALAKAEASQRLRFISYNQGQSAIFSESRKTEGVVFVDAAGRLSFAFNYINAKRLPSETSAIYASLSEADPLKIETSETPLLAPASYAELQQLETGEPAPMWVAADLKKLKDATNSAPPPSVTETAPNAKAKEETAAPVASKPKSNPPPTEKSVPAPASDDLLKQELKNKLKFMKELYDEGLISEKDYEGKKKALLEKID